MLAQHAKGLEINLYEWWEVAQPTTLGNHPGPLSKHTLTPGQQYLVLHLQDIEG